MADTVVAASLTLNADQANQSVKTFKTQLREAQQTLVAMTEKFGETSAEAVKAAKNVAALKDRMGDANKLVDAFNPDRKFQAFSNTISGVVGGFSALQGVMGLVGAEGENVQKALLKVQSALAISQGVNNILEMKDTFKQLGAVIQSTTIFQKANNLVTAAAAVIQKLFSGAVDQTAVSFKVLKGAIVATGIGALIVAIGFLIDAMSKWGDETEDMAKKQEELKAITDQLNESLQFSTSLQDRYTKENIAQAKARGAAETELQKIERKGYEDRIYFAEIALQDAKAKGVDTLKLEEELSIRKQNLRIYDFDQQTKFRERAEEEEKKARDKALADAKAAREKFLQERENNEKQAQEQIRKLQLDSYLLAIKDEEEREIQRILKENERDRERINALNLSAATRLQLLQELNRNEELELDAIKAERAEKEKLKDQERLQEGIDRMVEAIQKGAAIQKENAEKQIQQDELVYQNRVELQNRTASLFSQAAALFGKQTAAFKVLAIAGATIDTFRAANSALKADYGIFGPAAQVARFAAVALTIATGLKNVKEIAKTSTPGGGSTSVPSVSAAAPLAPTPQVTTTQLDQDSLNKMGNATVRAFVVESDVTNNQERITRLNRAARLGG